MTITTTSPVTTSTEVFRTLSNGVKVIIRGAQQKAATVAVFFNVGSKDESKVESGISHFIEHMCFKGSELRDAAQISLEPEQLGAYINAFTSTHLTCYHARGLKKHTSFLVEFLADISLTPKFPSDELERERAVILQEAAMYTDDGDHFACASAQASYKNSWVGRDIIGNKKTIKAFTRDDLVAYHKKHYHAKNVTVAVAGDYSVDEIAELLEVIEKRFGSIEGAPTRKSKPKVPVFVPANTATNRRTAQTNVAIVINDVVTTSAKELATAKLASIVLCGGMSSPLFRVIREELGLVYGISSHYSNYGYGAGATLTISAATSSDKVKELVANVNKVLQDVASDIQQSDVLRAKNSFLVQLATKSDGCPFDQIYELVLANTKYGQDVLFTDELISSISSTEISSVIARWANSTEVSTSVVGLAAKQLITEI